MPSPRRPKLGQHFLSDRGYRRRIVEALEVRPDDLVVEIGAGRGAMTGLLVERARRVVALEIDATLASALREEWRSHPGVRVLEADVLSADLRAIGRREGAERCLIFGNLPYYITSPIIHHLLDFRDSIRAMGLVVQKEVASRLAARPGSRAYGYLTVLAQLFSEPRIALSVPPGAFSPPPKVHSALVVFRMAPRFPAWSWEDSGKFLEFAKRGFARKRKTIANNLAGVYRRGPVEKELAALGLRSNARAEEMTIEQLAGLYEKLR